MSSLLLHPFHDGLNARFTEIHGEEVVESYGDVPAEYAALRGGAGVIDLSFRSRLCVTGADRARFLHGQVTNNVKDLQPGQGCYAALVNAKGKLESDLYIHCLRDELLLDFEPGLTGRVRERLERFIVSDDVQVVEVAPHYGLLGVLGPGSAALVERSVLNRPPPALPLSSAVVQDAAPGEIVIVNQSRGAATGFDLFVPVPALAATADKLIAAARATGGLACGWQSLEMIRIEAGLPRFGADMDETNLAPETGLEARAISYEKGCYIGQEVINKLRTFAHVTKSLRGLKFADDSKQLPARGDKLFHEGQEAGHITSALASPALGCNIALAYVRTAHNAPGTDLTLRTAAGEVSARVVPLPFRR